MVVHLSTVWERKKHNWRRELTLRASLSKATVKTLIDHGVSKATLDEPCISMKDDRKWIWHRVQDLFADARQEQIPFHPH